MLKKIITLELEELPDTIIVKFKGHDFPFYNSYQQNKEDSEEPHPLSIHNFLRAFNCS